MATEKDLKGDSPVQVQFLTDGTDRFREDQDAATLLYNQKSLLINKAIDAGGMGRYQWCIFMLCGFGYFLDLMWAQVFGLIIVPISQELNVSGASQANIFTAFSAGLTVGAFTWGLLIDIIGRRWAFNLTCLITSVFGFLVAAPSNFKAICAITALCGFGLGGNIPIDATITLEFLPQNRRFLLAMLSLFQPLGVTVCTILAYGLVPTYRCAEDLPACSSGTTPCCTLRSNIGWRYLVITLGAITLGIFILRFFVFHFHESPKFLIAIGKDQEAIDVVHKIAKFNKQPPPSLSIQDFHALAGSSELQGTGIGAVPENSTSFRNRTSAAWKKGVAVKAVHLKAMFSNRLQAITLVLLWLVYMGDFWAFNLAGGFLPIILARRGAAAAQTTRETYRQYIYIYLPGCIGSFIATGAMELPKVGRKWAMVITSALMSVSIALYIKVTTIAGSVGLNALEYIMQTAFNAILYAFTPEVFPAYYRGTAAGITSTLGRLSGIVAPKAAAPYNNAGSDGVLWLAFGGSMLATITLVFIPLETKLRQSL